MFAYEPGGRTFESCRAHQPNFVGLVTPALLGHAASRLRRDASGCESSRRTPLLSGLVAPALLGHAASRPSARRERVRVVSAYHRCSVGWSRLHSSVMPRLALRRDATLGGALVPSVELITPRPHETPASCLRLGSLRAGRELNFTPRNPTWTLSGRDTNPLCSLDRVELVGERVAIARDARPTERRSIPVQHHMVTRRA